MKIHPIAEVFPPMSDEDYAKLKRDIKENGQRVAIATHNDAIIDGKHRYRACTELGIDPVFRKWDGKGSMVAFVLSMNLHRRQLSTSQRAMVAANIVNMKLGDNQHGEGGQICTADSAAALNVSERSVKSAKVVKAEGSKSLKDAVVSGEVPVSVAASIASLPKLGQDKVLRESKRTGQSPARVLAEMDKPATENEWDTFNAGIDEVVREIKSAAGKLRTLLAFDEDKKPTGWGYFYSYSRTVGELHTFCKSLNLDKPARKSKKHPGFITARDAELHDSVANAKK